MNGCNCYCSYIHSCYVRNYSLDYWQMTATKAQYRLLYGHWPLSFYFNKSRLINCYDRNNLAQLKKLNTITERIMDEKALNDLFVTTIVFNNV